jgi:tRNA-Thr(GGU) m(6)t(6)A37 methyltransferase TsaA
MPLAFEPIGILHTPFRTLDGTPGQGAAVRGAKGAVEVFPEFAEGLKDIETFSHIILLYRFDRAWEVRLVRPSSRDKLPHGVFASRHPCRPNGIGMTVARLLERCGNRLEVEGIDMLDGTPLLDIKPYIARFDCFPEANEGWVSNVPAGEGSTIPNPMMQWFRK